MSNVRVVVVTGGAGGIGSALCRHFAAGGYRVALLDLDEPAAVATAATLRADTAGEVEAFACDVTDPVAVATTVAAVEARWGGIDVVVANAGISHHSVFAETHLAVFRKVMEVNFFGAVHVVHAALPSLRARRGVVVAMSSVAGFAPLLRRTAYAAAKHGLHGFLDTLREELRADGVAVILVCPTFVDTPIDSHAMAGDGSPSTAGKPVSGRLLRPEEVAVTVVRAVEHRGPDRVFVSGLARLSWWLSRVSPRAFAVAMRRSQADPDEP